MKALECCIPTQNVELAAVASVQSAKVLTAIPTETTLATTVTTTTDLSTTSTTITSTTTTITTPTTTTTVTTTTTTYPITTVYPCSSCSPIYNSACLGYHMPSASSYCLTSDEVPIIYTLGPVSDLGLPADTCSTRLGCPSGTVARVNVVGSGYIMGNGDGSPTLTYCSESDGIWYSDVDGHIYGVMDIACQYP